MKKTSIIISLLLVIFISNPTINPLKAQGSTKGNWTVQFSHSISTSSRTVAVDNSTYYVYANGLNLFLKYNFQGNLTGVFQITNVWNLGGITTDGNYLYAGSRDSNVIYKLDIYTSTPAYVSTITVNAPKASMVSYDSTADNNNGGFWVGGGNASIYLVDMNGNALDSIPAANHGLTDLLGSAFDNYSPGGPYLWVMNETTTATTTLTRLHIPSKMPSGIAKGLTGFICNSGEACGGLFIKKGIVGNTTTLGGVIVGKSLFGFDLSTAVADSLDMEATGFSDVTYNDVSAKAFLQCSFKNNGTDTINNFQVSVKVDNQQTIVHNINNITLPQFGVYNFSDSVSINSITGGNTIIAWSDSLNGLKDQSLFNDTNKTSFSIYDLGITNLNIAEHYPNTSNVVLDIDVKNFGIQNIDNYIVNYQIDNANTIIQNITSANLNTDSIANHQISFPAVLGHHTFKVWLSNPNGISDQISSNNMRTKGFTVYDSSANVPRTPLFELFTSSTCGPCVSGNSVFDAAFDTINIDNWTCVKYQMNWPGSGDPYYTTEGGIKKNYYHVTGVPSLFSNGLKKGSPQAFNYSKYLTEKNIPAFISMNAIYQVTNHTVDIYGSYTPTLNFNNGTYKMFIAIVENKTENNVGTNGETEFHYVMKKMVPNANGILLNNLTANQKVSFDKHYTFNGNYRLPANANSPINHSIEHSVEEFSDLSVVIWIQEMNSKEVMQSTWATWALSVNEKDDHNGIIGLFPNPSNDKINVNYIISQNSNVKINVFNSLGQLILNTNTDMQSQGMHQKTIDISKLKSGIYYLTINSNNQQFTRKFIVK